MWRVAVGHSRAQTARSSRARRCFLSLAPVTTALRLLGPVGRGEVWTSGIGTAVVMTPDPPRRTPTPTVALSTAVHGVVVVGPVLVAATTLGIGGPVAAVGPAAALGWLTGLLLPLVVTLSRFRHAEPVRLIREGVRGRTVRLHDLARHPADPAGTGVRLLVAVLTEPAYRDDTVITVAASPRLADLYAAAGMMVQPSTFVAGGAS